MEFGIGVSRLESVAVVTLGMSVYLSGMIERGKCISSGFGFYARSRPCCLWSSFLISTADHGDERAKEDLIPSCSNLFADVSHRSIRFVLDQMATPEMRKKRNKNRDGTDDGDSSVQTSWQFNSARFEITLFYQASHPLS